MDEHKKINCYTVLNISPTAPYNEIKTAYHRLCKLFHPDLSRDNSEEKQVELNIAFKILGNPILRLRHDSFWNATPARAHRKPAGDKPDKSSPAYYNAYEAALMRVREETKKREKTLTASHDRLREHFFYSYKTSYGKQRRRFLFKSFFIIASIAGCLFYPLLLPGILLIASILILPDAKVSLDFDSFFILSPAWMQRINRAAKLSASSSIAKEIDKLSRFQETMKAIKEEMMKNTLFSEPEDDAVRRITIAFFLLGYVPSGNDKKTRTIRLTISGDIILVRYRHRKGIPVNTAYLKKMADMMEDAGAMRGFLFCSPGLSGKALYFAGERNITSYTLKEMNDWIRNTYHSNNIGPQGSICEALDRLHDFLASIFPSRKFYPQDNS